MNAAAPITAVHLGIEYRGKVVREARWSGGLGQALGDGRIDECWQDFLQNVQASKLSSWANTLDNDLVTFIKQVLD